jgi:hypothetical protein
VYNLVIPKIDKSLFNFLKLNDIILSVKLDNKLEVTLSVNGENKWTVYPFFFNIARIFCNTTPPPIIEIFTGTAQILLSSF